MYLLYICVQQSVTPPNISYKHCSITNLPADYFHTKSRRAPQCTNQRNKIACKIINCKEGRRKKYYLIGEEKKYLEYTGIELTRNSYTEYLTSVFNHSATPDND